MKRKKSDLSIQKIPVPKEEQHIPPPGGNGMMPVHEFTMGLIAPKGSGKTTTLVNLLEIYAGYFHEIYVFSPTVKSDCKWDYVKTLKLLVDNMPLKKWIHDMESEKQLNGPVQPTPLPAVFSEIVDPEKKFQEELSDECFFEDEDISADFFKIVDRQFKMVRLLKKYGKLKSFANRVLIILDDQVGSELFDGSAKKKFKAFNTKHRHYSVSLLMVAQGYKEIPKTVRTNWTCLLLYKIGNMKELEVIYEEYALGLTWDEWIEMYRHATNEKYNFFFADMYTDDDGKKIRKNFDTALCLN